MPQENENQIVVDKAKLESLLAEFETMKGRLQIMESIADKSKLADYFEKTKDRNKRTCKLRVLRDENGDKKVVTQWGPMIHNEVYQSASGLSVAKQFVRVTLEDGKEIEGDMLDLGRRYEYVEADKLREIQEQDGTVKWEVRAENGTTYTIDTRFIN